MRTVAIASLLLGFALPALAQTQATQPVRETTDPINALAATWLKAEMQKRWPGKPIKFVVYSHNHDVALFRGYLEDLHAQVLAAARVGKSLEETKKSVDLSKYKDWAGYELMSQLNIEGVYRLVQANRRPNQ